jgi:hypothetical protein
LPLKRLLADSEVDGLALAFLEDDLLYSHNKVAEVDLQER